MNGTLGEIRLFAGNFAPLNWEYCSGQLLAIASNTALFTLIGTTYGGDGENTFSLPDLRGRFARGPFNGPGLTNVDLGEMSGTETVTLGITQIPAHNHNILVSNADPTTSTPTNDANALAKVQDPTANSLSSFVSTAPNTRLNNASMSTTGGSQAHSNLPPYLGMNYIICTTGAFPTRP